MSSLVVGSGLEDLELWLAGLFTAAELAAADLLLRLSGDDAAAPASTSTTPSSSPRWVSQCPVPEDLAVDDEKEERVAVGATELDRRATKRYRLLSDLYAATSSVTFAPAVKKRKTCGDDHEGGGARW